MKCSDGLSEGQTRCGIKHIFEFNIQAAARGGLLISDIAVCQPPFLCYHGPDKALELVFVFRENLLLAETQSFHDNKQNEIFVKFAGAPLSSPGWQLTYLCPRKMTQCLSKGHSVT